MNSLAIKEESNIQLVSKINHIVIVLPYELSPSCPKFKIIAVQVISSKGAGRFMPEGRPSGFELLCKSIRMQLSLQ